MLKAEGLSRSFGKREVVSDVSFEVRAGEVFGFLGPNGAGKTTTIRMLVGLARPDRGRVRIRDFDLARDFARAMAHVGSIVESPDLYGYLTGRENLQHFARMLPDGAQGRIAELASLVALEERRVQCRAWVGAIPGMAATPLAGTSLLVFAPDLATAQAHLGEITSAMQKKGTSFDLSSVSWHEASAEHQPLRPVAPGVQFVMAD